MAALTNLARFLRRFRSVCRRTVAFVGPCTEGRMNDGNPRPGASLGRASAVVALLFASLSLATPARAGIEPSPFIPVDWSDSFALRSTGGVEDPRVIFGFNPQPDPPVGAAPHPQLDLSNGAAPAIGLTGVNNPQTFRMLFSIGAASGLFRFRDATSPTDDFGALTMVFTGPAGNYLVEFGFTTSSSGVVDLASTVGFNPQPDPPLGAPGSASYGLDFSFTSLSDAFVSVRVTDPGGVQLTFVPAPEPAALAVFGLGLAGLGYFRRRRRAAG
jgi:hypothetical protein